MSPRDPLATVEAAVLVEELSSVTRHELRNELAIIRGAAYFVRRRVSETELWAADPRLSQFFASIDEHVEKATSITDREAVAARLYARRPAPTELIECVRAAIRWARVDAQVRFHAGGSRALVRVDPSEAALAVRCLLENAAEAMPGGGAVQIEVEAPAGSDVTVEIADEGGGFAPEVVHRAMEPFFTTKEGRTGLGLNIADRICKRYGGSLAIRPAEAGARVAVSFPVCGAPLPATGGAEAGPRLLLVDDNEGVRLALSAVLEDEGFVVDTAGSFREASGKIAPGAPEYAIALLDRHLGDRLGTDLIPLVRAAHPATKVVLLSGTSGADAGAPDVDAAFDKAGDLDELIAALRRLIAGSR